MTLRYDSQALSFVVIVSIASASTQACTLPTPLYFVRSSAKKHVDITIALANTLLCTAVFETPRRRVPHISKGYNSGLIRISRISGQALPFVLAAQEQ
jgi:hypothetical protein